MAASCVSPFASLRKDIGRLAGHVLGIRNVCVFNSSACHAPKKEIVSPCGQVCWTFGLCIGYCRVASTTLSQVFMLGV